MVAGVKIAAVYGYIDGYTISGSCSWAVTVSQKKDVKHFCSAQKKPNSN